MSDNNKRLLPPLWWRCCPVPWWPGPGECSCSTSCSPWPWTCSPLSPARAAADWAPGPRHSSFKMMKLQSTRAGARCSLGRSVPGSGHNVATGTRAASHESRATCPGSGYADCYAELISITKLVMCDVSLRHSRTQRNWIEVPFYKSESNNSLSTLSTPSRPNPLNTNDDNWQDQK